MLIHYQTLEKVEPEELQKLKNMGKKLMKTGLRVKLWRKSDIFWGLEPAEARWGYAKARYEDEIHRWVSAISELSRVTPKLTWAVYVEGNGGETLLRGGRCIAQRQISMPLGKS